MKRRSLFAVVSLIGLGSVALSCGTDKPAQCVYRDAKPLTENAATKMVGAKLISVGKAFVIAGLDGMTASWASLSSTGVVGTASTLTLTETPILPPELAVTSRTTPGDQLVVIYAIMNAEMRIELRAVTQVAGEAAAAPISVKVLDKGLALEDLRIAVGSSRTGQRATVAWGLAGQPGTKIETLLLGANGALAGSPIVFDPTDSWKCLQFVPSRTDWALTWVKQGATGNPWLLLNEGQDSMASQYSSKVGLSTAEVTCPVVSNTTRGYLIAWQTVNGTWVSQYDIVNANSVNGNFVVAAVNFGDVNQQPPIAGVTAMGFDNAVTFGVKSGAQVWLSNLQGVRVGDALKLPAPKGTIGPVSTISDVDAFYVTYRETPPTAPLDGPRWFMKVECPTN
jgi:hypothetical protein